MKTITELCKEAGLKGLSELTEISEIPKTTLNDWFYSKPFVVVACIHYAGKVKREEVEPPE